MTMEDLVKEFKELNPALADVYLFIEEHKAQMAEWDGAIFATCICMMLEEYCKANKLDVVDVTIKIASSVLDVNVLHGKVLHGKYGDH